jgi:hypothetical protein
MSGRHVATRPAGLPKAAKLATALLVFFVGAFVFFWNEDGW